MVCGKDRGWVGEEEMEESLSFGVGSHAAKVFRKRLISTGDIDHQAAGQQRRQLR